jgi:type VI secretion system protein ImpG
VPLQLSYTSADYPLLADGAHAADYEIHSVDAVRLVREGAGRAASPVRAPVCGVRRRAAGRRRQALLDHAARPRGGGRQPRPRDAHRAGRRRLPHHRNAPATTLSTMLTCTNRDLPSQLRYGDPQGDLRTDELSGVAPIRMLRKPSPSYRFGSAKGAHWRLISHLSLNHASLTMAGLDDFRKMLALYDLPRSPAAQRLIAGIRGLEHGAVRAWVKDRADLDPDARASASA